MAPFERIPVAPYEDRLTELRAEIDKVRGQNTRRSAARGAAAD